jgi:hypothetical protein
MSGQLHAPAALFPETRQQLVRLLGGPQSRSGRGGEEKVSQSLPGNLNKYLLYYLLVLLTSSTVHCLLASSLVDYAPNSVTLKRGVR